MKEKHIPIFLISGGFQPFADRLAKEVNLPKSPCHPLENKEGILTGTQKNIIDGAENAWIEQQVNQQLNTQRRWNRRWIKRHPHASSLGIPIGWHPKPALFPIIRQECFLPP